MASQDSRPDGISQRRTQALGWSCGREAFVASIVPRRRTAPHCESHVAVGGTHAPGCGASSGGFKSPIRAAAPLGSLQQVVEIFVELVAHGLFSMQRLGPDSV